MKIHCSKCNVECVPNGCSAGYAVIDNGKPTERKICYACADAAQREDLKDRSKKFVAYVSSDGQAITTWTGGKLMSVIRSRAIRLNRMSYTHGKYIQSIRARDIHGKDWIGQSSPGIAIRLRPVAAK